MAIVDIQNLSKTYVRDVLGTEYGRIKIRLKNRKVHALRNLTLSVEEGQIFGLLGPNGAGKTTAIKILTGIHFPTSGTATLMGRPLGDRRVKQQIGFLPENPYFYDYLKGWEFMEFYGELYGMSRSERRRRIPELLELVNLTHAQNIPLRGYSKGMLQRIGLAQALLNDPRLVILDEPQSGLDPFGRKEIRDIILRLRAEGKTVFFSSHILSDAEMICDRVAILHKGELRQMGLLQDLLSAKIKDYEIVVEGLPAEKVAAYEKQAATTLRRKADVLFIVYREDQAQAIVRDVAQTPGARLVSFFPRQESLEEYFIREIRRQDGPEGGSEGKEGRA
ncbi:MAG: ABC transporter ATP-binding protein [Candidatus Sumerlaeia bacterium]